MDKWTLLILGIIIGFLIICAVLSYTIFGYINSVDCANTDENAQTAKKYALYFGTASISIAVLMLIVITIALIYSGGLTKSSSRDKSSEARKEALSQINKEIDRYKKEREHLETEEATEKEIADTTKQLEVLKDLRKRMEKGEKFTKEAISKVKRQYPAMARDLSSLFNLQNLGEEHISSHTPSTPEQGLIRRKKPSKTHSRTESESEKAKIEELIPLTQDEINEIRNCTDQNPEDPKVIKEYKEGGKAFLKKYDTTGGNC